MSHQHLLDITQRIREAEGDRIVAVVGAGHVAGMSTALAKGLDVDVSVFDEIPRVSPLWKWVGWAIPALIVAALVTIGITEGPKAMGANALYWFLANAVPTALGAVALGLFDFHWLERCPLLGCIREQPRFVEQRAEVQRRATQVHDALYGDS